MTEVQRQNSKTELTTSNRERENFAPFRTFDIQSTQSLNSRGSLTKCTKLVAVALCVFMCGCASTKSALTTLFTERQAFDADKEAKDLQLKAEHSAAMAWSEYCQTRGPQTPHFERGFREGFADFMQFGGTGNPPSVPPRDYWGTHYQSSAGKVAVQHWFDGFRQGSQIAQLTGVRSQVVVPLANLTSSSAEAFQQFDSHYQNIQNRRLGQANPIRYSSTGQLITGPLKTGQPADGQTANLQNHQAAVERPYFNSGTASSNQLNAQVDRQRISPEGIATPSNQLTENRALNSAGFEPSDSGISLNSVPKPPTELSQDQGVRVAQVPESVPSAPSFAPLPLQPRRNDELRATGSSESAPARSYRPGSTGH